MLQSPPMLASLAVLAISCFAVPAPTARVSAVADARVEVGTGGLAGLQLAVPSLGVEWRVGPTLGVRALAIGLAPVGHTEDGRTSHGGAGGELGVRLIPFPTWTIQPFIAGTAGVLLFPGGAFLPGGDLYEFILNFGGGLEVPLGARAHLGLGLHWAHLSNGQGLGAFNPAFGGLGIEAMVRTDMEALDVARWIEWPPPARAPASNALAITGDVDVGVPGATYASGRVRLAQQFGREALAVAELEGGSFAGLGFGVVGLGLEGHTERGSLGAELQFQRWAGLDTYLGEVQAELRAAPELSLLLAGQVQHSALGELVPLAVGLRAFPLPTLCLDLGTGIDAARHVSFPEGLGPYFAAEWQLPFGGPDWQPSAFYERTFAQLNLFGVRVSWDAGESLQASGEHVWRRLR